MSRLPQALMTDPALVAVLDAIEAGGRRAYLVGGAVRNALLDQPVEDIDIATDARPDELVRLAEAAGLRPVPTGIEHGTITIVACKRGFEVTTFRHDLATDGRRAVVAFSDDLAEDAKRRDFTMNAIYADRLGDLVDPMGGLSDLRAGRLRFVGLADARIHEDYLRILRFFRFLAWYGRVADPAAVAACAAGRDGLLRIARERIGAEMAKLLAAPDPAPSLRLMAETGVMQVVLPGADPDRLGALIAAEAREGAPAYWLRRLAALSPDPATTEATVAAFRLSRADGRMLHRLNTAVALGWSPDEAGYRLGAARGADVALLRAACGLRLAPGWRARMAEAAAAGLPVSASHLAGRLQGPALGHGLRAAEAAWIASGFSLPVADLVAVALAAGATASNGADPASHRVAQ